MQLKKAHNLAEDGFWLLNSNDLKRRIFACHLGGVGLIIKNYPAKF